MFKFLKNIFAKEEGKNTPIQEKKVITINLDVSEESIRKAQENAEKEYANRWFFKENVEEHSLNWVTNSERKEIGFLGIKKYSKNRKFCIVGVGANDYLYNIALVDVENQKVIFRLKYNKPQNLAVSNRGFCAFTEKHTKSERLIILNLKGEIIYEKRHNQIIGFSPFDFSEEENEFVYELHTTHKIIKVKF